MISDQGVLIKIVYTTYIDFLATSTTEVLVQKLKSSDY